LVSSSRAVTIRGTSYPVFLPNIRDPRLHVAAVIITIHVLGQVALRFQVSVPQILAAILASAILEIALTFRTSKAFVWPASAMLTGSGVALIMRFVGTPAGDPWNTAGWELFALVGGGSLLTKYVIKYRGTHVFNPSNIGLVVAFIVLGSGRVEPLDFWWAPLELPMLLAYAVIIVGGLLITRRLKLLGLAAAYWVTLTIGVGILSASGHCMTATWAFSPVCGGDFWRAIVTSPEVLVFLFFMITDPKTTPSGQVGRVLFGLLVGVATTLMIAPMRNEFDTKVALLASLVVICAARPILDRLVPEPQSAADDLRLFASRLVRGAGTGAGAIRGVARVGLIAVTVLAVGVGIVAAGTPARDVGGADPAEILGRVPHQVDASTFPAITVQQDVADWNHELVGAGAQEVVLILAENLELENQALLRRDPAILAAACHGDRLAEMQARIAEAVATGRSVISRYRFDTLELTLREPFGVQGGMSLGLIGRGTKTEETYDASGTLQTSVEAPFDLIFVMGRPTSYRWLNVAVLPGGAAG
jgi:Na+-translocating ferredoxin:NAD+ oxidoreductase RnfD subunit